MLGQTLVLLIVFCHLTLTENSHPIRMERLAELTLTQTSLIPVCLCRESRLTFLGSESQPTCSPAKVFTYKYCIYKGGYTWFDRYTHTIQLASSFLLSSTHLTKAIENKSKVRACRENPTPLTRWHVRTCQTLVSVQKHNLQPITSTSSSCSQQNTGLGYQIVLLFNSSVRFLYSRDLRITNETVRRKSTSAVSCPVTGGSLAPEQVCFLLR